VKASGSLQRAVITTLQCTSYLWVLLLLLCMCHEASYIFHHRMWHRALSLRMRAEDDARTSNTCIARCTLCTYSTFGHHPHHVGYPCAKFRFCRPPPTAELARGEKSRTQSITHPVTHSPSLFDSPGTEAFASENVYFSINIYFAIRT